jgi:hypothetical protein
MTDLAVPGPKRMRAVPAPEMKSSPASMKGERADNDEDGEVASMAALFEEEDDELQDRRSTP